MKSTQPQPRLSVAKLRNLWCEDSRTVHLRPNRYFRFYLLKEKDGERTCWLPEGFHD